MKFVIIFICGLIYLFKNTIESTKFGPMSESLALGDVRYRIEDNVQENKINKTLNTTNELKLKKYNSTNSKIKSKKNHKMAFRLQNSSFNSIIKIEFLGILLILAILV